MDKNTVIAYVLILVVLFLMPFYFNIFSPPSPQQTEQPTQVSPDTVEQAQTLKDTVDTQIQITEPEPQEQEVRQESPDFAAESDTIVIETNDYWMTLSNRGGGTFQSIQLKHYPGPKGERYAELIPDYKENVFVIQAMDFQGDTLHFGTKLFDYTINGTSEEADTLRISDPTTIDFTYTTTEGGIITRAFTFYPNQYHVGFTVQLDQFRDVISNRRYQLVWNSPIAITETNASDDLNYSKAYSLLGDELVDIDASKAEPREPVVESYEGTTQWVAVRNKYFTSIITPVTKDAMGMRLVGTKRESADELTLKNYSANLIMPYSENVSQKDSFYVYIGPLDYNILNGYDEEYVGMMNLGWKIIRPISKAVLWAFTNLHKAIPNYGLVLILFGVAIKIIVFPLTKKSYVSMKEMQNLQPKIKELKEKYKDDSQKMNQEMMKIYKEHGVNPMGGCLPMLVQMPLLYSLFIVFRSTIELRGAEFIWWIKDLSQPDTVFTLPFSLPLYGADVNVLPLVMGITMIIQQRMTSSATSQQQKMMMWFMPIMFLLIFNNFPSGLNLYYALFNIMTIIQQKWFIDIPQAPTSPAKSK